MTENMTPIFDQMTDFPNDEDLYGSPGQTMSNSRYEILSAFHALQPQPPIDWIIDGLISAGSVNIFFGDGGSKKTYAMVDLLVCSAMGKSFLGYKTKKCEVLLIDEESGKRRILRRMGDVLRGHNAPDNTPIRCVSLAAFDFGKPSDVRELGLLITMTKSQLVVIDALADVMPGRDENAVKDVQPVFLALRKIAEDTQAAIIIIHHSNKGGAYRGSTAIKGALDLLVFVESKTGSNEITFKIEKARDTTASTFAATANFMPDAFRLDKSLNPVKPISASYNKAEKYVLLYLFNKGESNSKDILGGINPQVDPAPKSISNAISKLKKDGIIERTDNGASTATGTYKLSQTGELEAAEL